MVEAAAVGAAVVGVLLVALLGWWLCGSAEPKYDDPEAQRVHDAAQARDPSRVAPVGMETPTVVQRYKTGFHGSPDPWSLTS
jgi:hypothetical protein